MQESTGGKGRGKKEESTLEEGPGAACSTGFWERKCGIENATK